MSDAVFSAEQIGPHGFPCECKPTAKRGWRCTKKWLRCNKAADAMKDEDAHRDAAREMRGR